MPERRPADEQENQQAEHRLQVGAALVLGAVVLVGIVVRASIGNVLSAGWWRHW